jgi:hypothetical protein
VCVCVCVYVCMCVDICVCVYVFIQDPDPESDPDPGSDPKLCEKSDPDPKKIIPDPQHCFFGSKTTIYLSLGLHKGRPSYKRSLQLSKENIQHFKT